MGIRLPLQTVLDVTQANQGTTSVAGGWAYTFKLPMDCDNVVVKFEPSVTAGGASCFLQTSDDGGTTYYDIARTSVASNSGATAAAGARAQWISAGTISNGKATGIIQSASVITAGIGHAEASILGSQQVSGLPILGLQNRLFITTTGNATAVSCRARVLVNSQSRAN